MITILVALSSILAVQSPDDFARALEVALNKGDVATFDKAFDADAFYDRAVGKTELSATIAKLLKPLIQSGCVSQAVFTLSAPAYKFLRVRTVDGQSRALFRLVRAGGAFAYHDLVLDGQSRIVDVFQYHAGEFHSATARRFFVPDDAALKTFNQLKSPTDGDLAAATQASPFWKLSELRQEGDAKKVLAYFDEKKADLVKVRLAHVTRVDAARETDKATHDKAVAEMLEAFPDDATTHLAAILGFIRYRQLEKAIDAIDRLDKAVGGDGFLNVMRATAHLEAEIDLPKARAFAEKLTDAEPTLQIGWLTLIGIHATAKDFKELARCLTLFEKHTKQSIGDLALVPLYAEFMKSPEYAEWMKGRP